MKVLTIAPWTGLNIETQEMRLQVTNYSNSSRVIAIDYNVEDPEGWEGQRP